MPEKEEVDKLIREGQEGFSALNKAAIEYLQGKYGHDVQLDSTNAALRAILSQIDRRLPIELASAYDKGYDRTNPGYDRRYDRDSPGRFTEQELPSLPPDVRE